MSRIEKDIKEYFDAASLVGYSIGMKPIPKEDYDRFWRWMMVPLKDVPDDELIWCFHQYRQNSINSKYIWKAEIDRRGIKI